MRLTLFISACLLFAACSRSGVQDKSTSILGKWQRVAFENLSNSWKSERSDPSNTFYVEFTSDGKMISSRGEQELSVRHYSFTPDGKLMIENAIDAIDGIKSVTIQWNILTLDGFCFEPCGEKYKRVSDDF